MDDIQNILRDPKPALVVLYRPGDVACEEMQPELDELKRKLAGKANVVEVNGTENQDLMREFKIASYPAYLLFKDGQLAWRDYGRKHEGELEHLLRKFI